jgi:hypothetical protein
MTDPVPGILQRLDELYMQRLLRSERPGLPSNIAESRARDAHGVRLAIEVVREYQNG